MCSSGRDLWRLTDEETKITIEEFVQHFAAVPMPKNIRGKSANSIIIDSMDYSHISKLEHEYIENEAAEKERAQEILEYRHCLLYRGVMSQGELMHVRMDMVRRLYCNTKIIDDMEDGKIEGIERVDRNGPLSIQSWGYDTNGNPIPTKSNKRRDTSTSYRYLPLNDLEQQLYNTIWGIKEKPSGGCIVGVDNLHYIPAAINWDNPARIDRQKLEAKIIEKQNLKDQNAT